MLLGCGFVHIGLEALLIQEVLSLRKRKGSEPEQEIPGYLIHIDGPETHEIC